MIDHSEHRGRLSELKWRYLCSCTCEFYMKKELIFLTNPRGRIFFSINLFPSSVSIGNGKDKISILNYVTIMNEKYGSYKISHLNTQTESAIRTWICLPLFHNTVIWFYEFDNRCTCSLFLFYWSALFGILTSQYPTFGAILHSHLKIRSYEMMMMITHFWNHCPLTRKQESWSAHVQSNIWLSVGHRTILFSVRVAVTND